MHFNRGRATKQAKYITQTGNRIPVLVPNVSLRCFLEFDFRMQSKVKVIFVLLYCEPYVKLLKYLDYYGFCTSGVEQYCHVHCCHRNIC